MRKYAQKYLRYHKGYEKRANTELRKVFKAWTDAIKWDELQAGSYSSQISNAFDITLMNNAYINIYHSIGLVHGKRIGKDINRELKDFTFAKFLTIFEMNLGAYLRQYGIGRVITVRKQFFDYIIQLIGNQLNDDMSMQEVSRRIQIAVNRRDFYRWQAMRIARTESTAASNYAALQSSSVTGYAMNKVWIATMDARTREHPDDRFDHRDMHDVRVPLHGKFLLEDMKGGIIEMDFPGDPTAPAGAVINCRCAVASVPARDKNGKLIRL